jgi:hypothetical protein
MAADLATMLTALHQNHAVSDFKGQQTVHPHQTRVFCYKRELFAQVLHGHHAERILLLLLALHI